MGKVLEKAKNPWIGVILAAIALANSYLDQQKIREQSAAIEAKGKSSEDDRIESVAELQKALKKAVEAFEKDGKAVTGRLALLEKWTDKINDGQKDLADKVNRYHRRARVVAAAPPRIAKSIAMPAPREAPKMKAALKFKPQKRAFVKPPESKK